MHRNHGYETNRKEPLEKTYVRELDYVSKISLRETKRNTNKRKFKGTKHDLENAGSKTRLAWICITEKESDFKRIL